MSLKVCGYSPRRSRLFSFRRATAFTPRSDPVEGLCPCLVLRHGADLSWYFQYRRLKFRPSHQLPLRQFRQPEIATPRHVLISGTACGTREFLGAGRVGRVKGRCDTLRMGMARRFHFSDVGTDVFFSWFQWHAHMSFHSLLIGHFLVRAPIAVRPGCDQLLILRTTHSRNHDVPSGLFATAALAWCEMSRIRFLVLPN